MALPPQRLVNDDLFIVNRITANDVDTYKVNADDIGVFLLEAPAPGGGNQDDKFINDGEINIYGKLQNLGASYLNLHSANEHCEGKLSFDEGFHITGQHMDVLITHDYATLAKELSCDDGGIDGTTTCLKLDMEWLSDSIVTGCSGLESGGSCIGINLCDDISGLTFLGDGCLKVNLCPNNGIVYHPNNGCLELDLNYLAVSLSCDGLRPADGNVNSSCMEIDMEWLTDNIRCGSAGNSSAYGGSGLTDKGGCLSVNPCWVNDQLNAGNPQYMISDYDATSIDTKSCKLRVNEAWLLQWAKDNIQQVQIADDALCIKIAGNKNLFKDHVVIDLPENCMKTWVEGEMDSYIKDIIGLTGIDVIGGNASVAKGTVSLQVNEPYIQGLIDTSIGNIPAPPTPGTPGDGKLEIVAGSGISIERVSGGSEFTANQTSNTKWKIKNTGSTGSGSPPTDACNNGGLNYNSSNNCLSVDIDAVATKACDDSLTYNSANNCLAVNFPESCPAYEKNVSGGALYSRSSGSKLKPALVIGTKDAADDGKAWAGIGSNVDNGSWSIYFSYKGWKNINNCGGESRETDREKIRIIQSVACGDKVNPHFANVGLVKQANVLNGTVQCFNYGKDGSFHGGAPLGGGAYTRFCFVPGNGRSGDFPELPASDTRTVIDIDSMIDELGTRSSGGQRGISTGMIRWNLKKSEDTVPYAAMYIDTSELAAKFPALVEWTASEEVYDVVETLDSNGEFESYDHITNPDKITPENMEPGQLNTNAMFCALLLANKRLKTRIDQLEQEKTSRAGTLNTLGISEYSNETAAANSGLGQGEIYWDTTLNRMRAVT